MQAPFNGLSIARDLAARGYKVFPLKPGSKAPANANGFKSATSDSDAWHDATGLWWADTTCNVGIATGVEHPNGGYLTVVDLDRHPDGPDGVESWAHWCSEHTALPPTMCVKTPQNGLHLYFLSPIPLPTRGNIRPGIDVKGEGGYVVAPGSITDHGRYELGILIDLA